MYWFAPYAGMWHEIGLGVVVIVIVSLSDHAIYGQAGVRFLFSVGDDVLGFFDDLSHILLPLARSGQYVWQVR